jgi:REP element-mobilizing transposase RayT
MPDLHIHHDPLPTRARTGATYFVTWRLADAQAPLNAGERDLIVEALRHFGANRYELLAFVVMDDHVHVLVQPFRASPLEGVVHSWKSYSARVLEKRGRRAGVWAHGYDRRRIRGEPDYEEKLAHIRTNPQRRWPGARGYRWVWYDSGTTSLQPREPAHSSAS